MDGSKLGDSDFWTSFWSGIAAAFTALASVFGVVRAVKRKSIRPPPYSPVEAKVDILLSRVDALLAAHAEHAKELRRQSDGQHEQGLSIARLSEAGELLGANSCQLSKLVSDVNTRLARIEGAQEARRGGV